MTTMELLVRRAHGHYGERPFQRFGCCSACYRYRDDGGRLLYVTGRRRASLVCLECFDLGGRR